MAAEMNANGTDPAVPTSNKRKLALLALAVVVVLIAVGYGLYWFLHLRFFESTDAAYVTGNIVQVTPQVGGTVVQISADDTDLLQQGDVVAQLDESDAKLALEQSKAELAQAVRRVRNLYAVSEQASASARLRELELRRAKTDLERRTGLEEGAVALEDVQHATESVATAEAALAVAKQQFATSQSLIDHTELATHPEVLAAASRVRNSYLALQRTRIISPVTGYVAKRSVQVGQRVAPGTPLLAVVPLNDVWVEANFKEVQLGALRIGQPVTLTADSYGDDVKYHGTLAGVSAGTGGAFALLPAQNATGNWIKIVQRVPVRIALDRDELKKHPLRVGLSMQVSVDVHDSKGSVLAAAPRGTAAYTTAVYDDASHTVDDMIQKIITDNSGESDAHRAAVASTATAG
jgi:membrane fusion protein (multidrug efflux system)